MAREDQSTAHGTKATAAQKFFCAVGDQCNNSSGRPVSQRAQIMSAYGYKNFFFKYGENELVYVALAASDEHTVELNTLISYPDRRGNGSRTAEQLCGLADKLGVTLWLNALPFGRNRAHIPLAKLKSFYRSLGFAQVRRINPTWVNGYHRWDRSKFEQLMIRVPNVAVVAA